MSVTGINRFVITTTDYCWTSNPAVGAENGLYSSLGSTQSALSPLCGEKSTISLGQLVRCQEDCLCSKMNHMQLSTSNCLLAGEMASAFVQPKIYFLLATVKYYTYYQFFSPVEQWVLVFTTLFFNFIPHLLRNSPEATNNQ